MRRPIASVEVMAKAAELARSDRIVFRPGRWQRVDVEGVSGRYVVSVRLGNWTLDVMRHGGPLIREADCSCPAGQAGKTCHHLLAVLALLERDGYRLER